jgi:hypothetical protein
LPQVVEERVIGRSGRADKVHLDRSPGGGRTGRHAAVKEDDHAAPDPIRKSFQKGKELALVLGVTE